MLVATLTPAWIAIIVVLLLLYFNRKKLPGLGKSIGTTLRQTKRSFDQHQARQDAQAEIVDAHVVSEEDVTRARSAAHDRDEV